MDYFGAAICVNGHAITSVLRPGEQHDPRCKKCGAEVIAQCRECTAPLRGSIRGVIAGYSVPNNCWNCGAAFPWRQKQLGEAQEILALRFDTEDWDTATKDRLTEVMGKVATDSVSPDYIMAVADWLDRSSGPVAKRTLWEIVKTVGTDFVVTAVKAKFGIP